MTIDERIAQKLARVEQLRRQKKSMLQREAEQKKKSDTRRFIILGEYLAKHFPYTLNLTPRKTKKENNVEFAPLDKIFATLAKRPEISALFDSISRPSNELEYGSEKEKSESCNVSNSKQAHLHIGTAKYTNIERKGVVSNGTL